jgi:hypothetical protein
VVTYELYSIVCHSDTLNFGHYTCFCKENDYNWYFFDDLNGIRFADLSKIHTADYRKCSSTSYVLFFVRKTEQNEPFSIEKQFSQLNGSQSSKLETPKKARSSSPTMLPFKESSDKDDVDGSDDEKEDFCGPENFKFINNVKIFFNHHSEPTVSGFMCLNNILEKQVFKETEVEEALYIWKTIEDIRNLVSVEKFFLEHINVANFETMLQLPNESIFLIDNNKQFMIIKNIDNKWFLLNPLKTTPEEITHSIVKKMNLMKKNNENIFDIYKVIKIQGNSSIKINKINTDSVPHHADYGFFGDYDQYEEENEDDEEDCEVDLES